MISIRITYGLSRVSHVCIDCCFKMLINKMTLPKRGLSDGSALLQAQVLHRYVENLLLSISVIYFR